MNSGNEQSKEKTFQVVDKRRFSADGQERPADAASTPETVSTGPSVPPRDDKPSAAQRPAPGESRDFTMRENADTEAEPVAFTSFIMSLATQALVQLGEMPPPHGMEIPVDLDSARQTIDILSMLQRRTKGNLSQEESRFLEDVVHSLRVSFIKAKQGPK